eukprot:652050-Prorocentrum_minimum.AAC.3
MKPAWLNSVDHFEANSPSLGLVSHPSIGSLGVRFPLPLPDSPSLGCDPLGPPPRAPRSGSSRTPPSAAWGCAPPSPYPTAPPSRTPSGPSTPTAPRSDPLQ